MSPTSVPVSEHARAIADRTGLPSQRKTPERYRLQSQSRGNSHKTSRRRARQNSARRDIVPQAPPSANDWAEFGYQ
eukprot:590218-Pyramimonas_sp.AAC.1